MSDTPKIWFAVASVAYITIIFLRITVPDTVLDQGTFTWLSLGVAYCFSIAIADFYRVDYGWLKIGRASTLITTLLLWIYLDLSLRTGFFGDELTTSKFVGILFPWTIVVCSYWAYAHKKKFGDCKEEPICLPKLPITYYSWSWQHILGALFSLLVLTIFQFADLQSHPVWIWLRTIFFCICSLIFLAFLLPWSSSLKLDESGISATILFRRWKLSWVDVQSFYPIEVGPLKMVGIMYSKQYSEHRKARKIARFISGADGALPDSYGQTPEKLAAVLNLLREQYDGSRT